MKRLFRLDVLVIVLISFVNSFNVPNVFATGNKDFGELVENRRRPQDTSQMPRHGFSYSGAHNREREELTMTGPI